MNLIKFKFFVIYKAIIAETTNVLGIYNVISKTNWDTSELIQFCGGIFSVYKIYSIKLYLIKKKIFLDNNFSIFRAF